MSGSKYVKIQSLQNGAFTASNNRADWIIPSSMGKVSLEDSFIQIYSRLNVVDGSPEDGTGVYMGNLQWTQNGRASDNHFDNVALIRNSRISSSNHGNIEALRRSDILRQNMTYMRQSQTEVDSLRYITGDSLTNLENNQHYSLYTDVEKIGSVASTNNENTPLMVRLGDILDFCNVGTVSMAKLGDTRIHTELNIANIIAKHVYPEILPNGDKVEPIVAPASNTAVNTLTTLAKYPDLNASPWYVGQKLEYIGTINGVVGTSVYAVITSITQNVNGSMTLQFGKTLFTLTPANGGATAGTLVTVAPTSITPEFHRMELVLKVVADATPDITKIEYQQFDTYELNGNSATTYTNVVEVHGDAKNCVILPLDDTKLDAKLVIDDFRLACNNVELTDSRNVIPYTSLYYDRILHGMDASDYMVKNLQNPLYENSEREMYSADQSAVIVMPLFRTANRKNLQININSIGLEQYVLYTAVPRTVSL